MLEDSSAPVSALLNETCGLVLAGGKSARMGEDKGLINYHLSPERYRIYSILELLCKQCYISANQKQLPAIDKDYQTLIDPYPDSGPLGAIVGGFEKFQCNLFMLPTDLPLIQQADLLPLCELANSDHTSDAVLFRNSSRDQPEPLAGIWRLQSLAKLKSAFESGQRSLIKLLGDFNISELMPSNPQVLLNANDPATRDEVMHLLKKQRSTP